MEPHTPSLSRRPSTGKNSHFGGRGTDGSPSVTAPRYHHYTPDVSRSRPSTASRSKFVGQYRQLNRLIDKPGFSDETQKTMEFLVCAQHLDNGLSQRQLVEKPTIDGLPSSGRSSKKTRSDGVNQQLFLDDDELLSSGDEQDGPLVKRRHEIDILTRRTQCQEAHIARKLGILMKGEQRRAEAEHTRISRPLVERDLKRSLTWLKLVHTVRPAILLGEQLREHQARTTLQSLFSVQILRFLKRRRERIARRRWMAGRVEKMNRPTAKQIAKAVPVMKHFPQDALDELISEMTPHCFKNKEYMSYTAAIDKEGSAGNPATGGGLGNAVNSMLPTNSASTSSPGLQDLTSGVEGLNSQSQSGGLDTVKQKVTLHTPQNSKGMIYFIESGIVDVFYTNLGHQSHSHHHHHSTKTKKIVERLNPGQAVGVEALLMTEARKHIAVCKSEVNAWALPVSALFSQIQKCSASVQQLFNEIAEDRRREMMRLQPLTEPQLRQASAFFNEWTTAGIAKVLRVLDPIVLNKGRECSKGVYFVVHGRLDVVARQPVPSKSNNSGASGSSSGGLLEVVKSGQAYGELQSYFPEDRRVKIVAATATDAWFLRRADLLEYAAHENISSLLPLLERAMNRPPGHHHSHHHPQQPNSTMMDLANSISMSRKF